MQPQAWHRGRAPGTWTGLAPKSAWDPGLGHGLRWALGLVLAHGLGPGPVPHGPGPRPSPKPRSVPRPRLGLEPGPKPSPRLGSRIWAQALGHASPGSSLRQGPGRGLGLREGGPGRASAQPGPKPSPGPSGDPGQILGRIPSRGPSGAGGRALARARSRALGWSLSRAPRRAPSRALCRGPGRAPDHTQRTIRKAVTRPKLLIGPPCGDPSAPLRTAGLAPRGSPVGTPWDLAGVQATYLTELPLGPPRTLSILMTLLHVFARRPI